MLRRSILIPADLARKISLVAGYVGTSDSEFIRASAEAEIARFAANNDALATLLDGPAQ